MKFNNGLVLSTVALALMATGCVKKQDNVTASGTYDTSATTTSYDTGASSTNYETASPLIYDTGSGVTNSSTYSEIIPDNTVITTDSSGSYGSGEIIDNYSDTQSSGAFSTNNGSGESSSYSYGGYSGTDYSSSTTSSSSSQGGGGIHLQVAALKDYYAAEEFKNSLSLDSKYTAYIQRGAINKVIISGISSVSEANRLKERRFPGAFIVRNTGGNSSSSSAYGSSSYGSSSNYNASYTDNSAYGSYNSSSSSSGVSGSVGVQIGAFSSRGKAQSVANANSGQYKAIVEKGTSRGRTIYRVILTGFSSRSDAKRALSSGRIANGFVTTVH
jgi:hypothetical protein